MLKLCQRNLLKKLEQNSRVQEFIPSYWKLGNRISNENHLNSSPVKKNNARQAGEKGAKVKERLSYCTSTAGVGCLTASFDRSLSLLMYRKII